jgi:hypothetical protein
MFGSRSLVSTRETVAVLAIMARRDLPWNRIAGAVEEEGSALRLLGQAGGTATDRLFEVDQQQVTLDQLEDWVLTWERDGIERSPSSMPHTPSTCAWFMTGPQSFSSEVR